MLKLLHRGKIGVVVVEHRARLARFGFDHIGATLGAQGRWIVALEDGKMADDVVRDLHDIIVSMCARLPKETGGWTSDSLYQRPH